MSIDYEWLMGNRIYDDIPPTYDEIVPPPPYTSPLPPPYSPRATAGETYIPARLPAAHLAAARVRSLRANSRHTSVLPPYVVPHGTRSTMRTAAYRATQYMAGHNPGLLPLLSPNLNAALEDLERGSSGSRHSRRRSVSIARDNKTYCRIWTGLITFAVVVGFTLIGVIVSAEKGKA